ncbi:hypothetical protein ABPG75_013333 [Micractinium tetrahymenae]
MPVLSFVLRFDPAGSPLTQADTQQQLITNMRQAASMVGASQEPLVSLQQVARRRSLAAANSGLLVTSVFATGDEQPAQALGRIIVSSPQQILSADTFGAYTVTEPLYNNQPIPFPSPPPPSGGAPNPFNDICFFLGLVMVNGTCVSPSQADCLLWGGTWNESWAPLCCANIRMPPPRPPPPPTPSPPRPPQMVLSFTLQSPSANASCISNLNKNTLDLFGWEAMTCSGISQELMGLIRAALAQAALAAGASAAPDVTSYFHQGSLPYSGGPWGFWEVNITLPAADAGLALQLASVLLANAQALLPQDQYGQLLVSSVLVDGAPYSPPRKHTPKWLVALAVTLSLLVLAALVLFLVLWLARRRRRREAQQLRQGRLTMQPSQELSPSDLANATASSLVFTSSGAASSVPPAVPPPKRATRGSMAMFVHVHADGQAAGQAATLNHPASAAGKHSIANSFIPPNPSVLPPADLAQLDELAAAGDPEAEALAEAGPSPSAVLMGQQPTGPEEFYTPGAPPLASPTASPSIDASATATRAAASALPGSGLAGSLPGSPLGAGSMAAGPSLQASPSGASGSPAGQSLATQPPAAGARQSAGPVPPTMPPPPWSDEGATQVPLRRVSSALRRLVGGLPAPLPLSRLSGASVAAGSGRPSRALPSAAEQDAAGGASAWTHPSQPALWQRNHANSSVTSTEGAETVRLRRVSSALRRLVSTKLRAHDLGQLEEPSEQGEALAAEHLPSGWASELPLQPSEQAQPSSANPQN